MNTRASSKRLDYIDSLRGIAAFAVVAQHSLEVVRDARAAAGEPHGLLDLMQFDGINLGRFGVILFFLISGFVIPFSFKGETALRDFVVSRLFRLYPAYWLSLLTGVIVFWAVYATALPPAQILANVTMVQKLFGQPDVLGQYWTLFYEILFYGACVALFVAGRLTSAGTLAVCALACMAVPDVTALMTATGLSAAAPRTWPIFLAFMFTGALARRAFLEEEARARVWLIPVVPLLFLSVLAASGFVVPVDENTTPTLVAMPNAIGYTAALAVFLLAVVTRRPAHPILVWMGAISYAVYLFQMPVLWIADGIVPQPAGMMWLPYLIFVFGTLTVTSALVYRFVEKPSIALGRRITHWRRGRLAAEVAP